MSVTRDSLARWHMPANATEWTELLDGTGIVNPEGAWNFEEASAPIIDLIGTRDLALGSGDTAPAYQQPLPGWTKTCVKMAAGAQTRLLNNTLTNVNSKSYTLVLIARLELPATDRTIMRMGDVFNADACLEQISGGIQVGNGDGASRETFVSDADVIGAPAFFTLRIDDTANTVDAFFNTTKIVGGTQACSGTELCVGGNNAQTNNAPTMWCVYLALFDVTLSDANIATLISRVKDGAPAAGGGSGYSRSRVVNA